MAFRIPLSRLPLVRRLPPLVLLLTAGLSLAACAVTWNGFTLVEYVRERRSGWIHYAAPTSEKPEKVVALTFDDGPDPTYTPRVLAILRQHKVSATFFLIGRQVAANPDLARAIVADGHAIGNHTFTHPYLNRQSPQEAQAEMRQCSREIEAVLHLRPTLFRPPRGDWNPAIFAEARREGMHTVLWTVAVEHSDAPTPQAMADRALRLIRPGGILLLHDGCGRSRETTVQALPLILDGLQKRGYRCVTVPNLLHL